MPTSVQPYILLRKTGREYFTWPVSGIGDADAVEVSINETTWVPTTRTAGFARALVAGPAATGNPADTLVVPLGDSRFILRRTSTPEIIERDAGVVHCK